MRLGSGLGRVVIRHQELVSTVVAFVVDKAIAPGVLIQMEPGATVGGVSLHHLAIRYAADLAGEEAGGCIP